MKTAIQGRSGHRTQALVRLKKLARDYPLGYRPQRGAGSRRMGPYRPGPFQDAVGHLRKMSCSEVDIGVAAAGRVLLLSRPSWQAGTPFRLAVPELLKRRRPSAGPSQRSPMEPYSLSARRPIALYERTMHTFQPNREDPL
jgi:hypothetical protein